MCTIYFGVFISDLNAFRPVLTPIAALFVNNKITIGAHNIAGHNNNKIPAVLQNYFPVTQRSRNVQSSRAIASPFC